MTHVRSSLSVAWSPPTFGGFKVNVDAATRPQGNVVASVCRDSAGAILGASLSRGISTDPLVGEARGVLFDLHSALALGLPLVLIEADKSQVVDALQDLSSPSPWQIFNDVCNAPFLFGSFRSCKVVFTPLVRIPCARFGSLGRFLVLRGQFVPSPELLNNYSSIYAALLIQTRCHGHLCLPEKHVALLVFGDSLFDAGNNNYINTTSDYRSNVWPYGETFFKYPTGRFSDGRIIPDFIAEYAKLPLITPYLHPAYSQYTDGANFASAGAGALVGTHRGFVVDLQAQLRYFKNLIGLSRQKLGDADARALLGRALYLFSIGTNDYVAPFATNSSGLLSYSREEYVDMVIGNLTIVIKEIHKNGGRKFGFQSLPPVGSFPYRRALINNAVAQEITARVILHNKALSKVLVKLERQLNGFRYSMANMYNFLGERTNYPSKYGFKEGKIACCGTGPHRGINSCGGKRSAMKEYELCHNPRKYVFFDSGHPTEMANEQFAKLMWSGTPNDTGPYNLKALFEL
ncbi:GDSL esterase/lipase 1 [Morella rubra]|uniref:GDSL esterase/lipase 1 n=1 Tax=Morella rubra TaxID=262757 RepID=A0A6A1W086_9ROSI|nr:GDSL esterase/lipase 1 [Morella rubra]